MRAPRQKLAGNTWKVVAAVTPWYTLRVSWQAHMAGPSPAEARASRPDPSAGGNLICRCVSTGRPSRGGGRGVNP